MNNTIKNMLKLTEGVNSFSNESLLFLKQAVDYEIKERNLKIKSDEIKHPSWLARMLLKMKMGL